MEFGSLRRRGKAPTPQPPNRSATFFSRGELAQILSVYSRKVIAGEWRDYAIEVEEDGTAFAIYSRKTEGAAFRISKRAAGAGRRYRVTSGARILGYGRSLGGVLEVFGDRHLRLIEPS